MILGIFFFFPSDKHNINEKAPSPALHNLKIDLLQIYP